MIAPGPRAQPSPAVLPEGGSPPRPRPRRRGRGLLAVLILLPLLLFQTSCGKVCQDCFDKLEGALSAQQKAELVLQIIQAANPVQHIIQAFFIDPIIKGLTKVYQEFVKDTENSLPPPLRNAMDGVTRTRAKLDEAKGKLKLEKDGRYEVGLEVEALRGKLADRDAQLSDLRLAHSLELEGLEFTLLADLILRLNNLGDLLGQLRLDLSNYRAEEDEHRLNLERFSLEDVSLKAKRARIKTRLGELQKERTPLELEWEKLSWQKADADKKRIQARRNKEGERRPGGNPDKEKDFLDQEIRWGEFSVDLNFKLDALLLRIQGFKSREEAYSREDFRLEQRELDIDRERRRSRLALPQLKERRKKKEFEIQEREREMDKVRLDLKKARQRIKVPKNNLEGAALDRHKQMLAALAGYDKKRKGHRLEVDGLRKELELKQKTLASRDLRIKNLELRLKKQSLDYEADRLQLMRQLQASEAGRQMLRKHHLALLRAINAEQDIKASPMRFSDGGHWEEDLGYVTRLELEEEEFSRVDWSGWSKRNFKGWDPNIKPINIGLQRKALIDASLLSSDGPDMKNLKLDIHRELEREGEKYRFAIQKKHQKGQWHMAPCDLPESSPFPCVPPSPWGPPLAPLHD